MEPIAIIGLGCRFPGAPDPASFWQLLRDGGDAIRDVPPDRWDADALYDPDPDAPGKMTSRRAGFLDQIDQFDAAFFGISPREARSMDPQQRLLLEVAWEALEQAGLPPPRLAGTSTGVFVGICSFDYAWRQAGDPALTEAYSGTGAAHSIAANRLSYLLDLRGPSMAIDTACSSSLIAVHLACQSIWRGEATLALAGGVNVIASPEASIGFSKARMLAVDGRCKTFDAAADGYVRGEGCGVVVLKPLAAAQRDGDTILALVRGSATNQDGRSNGLTAPNGPAQQAVIREALRVAGVTPSAVGFVEAHGTGTPLGDPIELQALLAVLGKGRPATQPLVVGSVKPNIGHLEGAAGIAALVKAVLCLHHEEIPPQVNFSTLNPLVRPGERLVIPTERRDWLRGPAARFAGVSSFGFGGANAHVVLEEGPSAEEPTAQAQAASWPAHLLTISARTESALRIQAGRLARQIEQSPARSLADLCFSAGTTRAHFEHRLAVMSSSTDVARVTLERFAAGAAAAADLHTGRVASRSGLRVAFLFTGQGSQYPKMGHQVYDAEPTFRRTLDHCAEILAPLLDRPLLDVLYPTSGSEACLHETAYAQPALFALEYALAELWRSWGVQPAVLLGHSIGEYVAACVAGVFSLEDGLKLVAARGRLMQVLSEAGSMAAVLADEIRVAAAIVPYSDSVSVAAVNAPDSVVISGAAGSVDEIIEKLRRDGIVCQPLNVSHAFHSRLMDPMLDAFGAAAHQVTFSAPTTPLVSNLTGRLWQPGEVPDAAYWLRHAREAVRFEDGVRAVAEQRCTFGLEIGPQPVLSGLARRCNPVGVEAWLPSLQQGRDDLPALLSSLGALYVRGLDVDWRSFYRDRPGRRVALPTYPFERERFWIERRPLAWERTEPPPTPEPFSTTEHPLLGRRLTTAHPTFEALLSPTSPPYLADHRVRDTTILPAAAYLEMAAAAVTELTGEPACTLTDVRIEQAMVLDGEHSRRTQVVLVPAAANSWTWTIHSQPAITASRTAQDSTGWTLHARGSVRRIPADASAGAVDLPTWLREVRATSEERSVSAFYADLERRGYQYGPAFRAVDRLWWRDGTAFGQIVAPAGVGTDAGAYRLHPALLDAALQVLAAALSDDSVVAGRHSAFVPVGLDTLRVHGRLASAAWCQATIRPHMGAERDVVTGDCTLYDEGGQVIAELQGLRSVRLRDATDSLTSVDTEQWLYEIVWRPRPLTQEPQAQPSSPNGTAQHGSDSRSHTSAARGSWLILADGGGTGAALAGRLAERGDVALLVSPGEEFTARGDRHVTVNPMQASDFHRALTMLAEAGAPPVRGLIHLWSLHLAADMDLDAADLDGIEMLSCGAAVQLVQAAGQLDRIGRPRLWLVTRGAMTVGDGTTPVAVAQAPLWGMSRTIVHEQPDLRCSAVDLDPSEPPDDVDALLAELDADDREDQVTFRDGGRYVARLVRARYAESRAVAGAPTPDGEPLRVPDGQPFQIAVARPGTIDLVARPLRRSPPGPGDVEIEVRAAGLNFRDVMKAMGLYPDTSDSPSWIGDECSGTVSAVGEGVAGLQIGDEVLAVAPASFGSFVTAQAACVVAKPASLGFEEAASIPIAVTTALYALNHLGRLEAGERVLIHAASGGVGLAAVEIARRRGAIVYATAGSPEKCAYLHSIGVEHVMDSRSMAFSDEVLLLTNGDGVDLVLNSLPGEAIGRGVACLAPHGRFVEIGKRDLAQNATLGLAPFQRNLTFSAVDMQRLFRERPERARALLQEAVALVGSDSWRATPVRSFPAECAQEAFRLMARTGHIGKLVLAFPRVDGAPLPVAEAAPGAVRADATYLVTGGLGALGLAVAGWLVERGARTLVLVSRRAPSPEAQATIDALSRRAHVEVIAADVVREDHVRAILDRIAQTLPPLRGIMHAAGVLDGGLASDLRLAQLQSVMGPKIRGTHHLHALTAELPLDFFVLFSSAAAVLGSPGQSNYAAANAFLDAVAHERRRTGRPALSVNWGFWGEAGMAARFVEEGWTIPNGIGTIAPPDGLDVLGRLMDGKHTQVAVVPIDWNQLRRFAGPAADRPLVEDLMTAPPTDELSATGRVDLPVLRELGPNERRARLEAYLSREVARVLQRDSARIERDRPLMMLGLDSLTGMVLRNRIEADLAVTLPLTSLAAGPTIVELAAEVADLALGVPGKTPEGAH